MTDVRVLGNAVPGIKARVAAAFGALGIAVRVADEAPADWRPKIDPPLITVEDDGGPILWPVYAQPIIRITVHADGKQTAKRLRGIALGAIMASPILGIADLRTTDLGYSEARDDPTGADLASLTVPVTVRTEVISA